MNKKWKKLAGEILRHVVDEYGNKGCNEWEYPPDWTEKDKLRFATALVKSNVGRKRLNEDDKEEVKELVSANPPPDWWVASFLLEELLK